MSVELRLPNINAETNEGKIEQLQSFIYQLVQELNWYLNLEKTTTSTTDDTEIKKLVNKVEDAEGNFSSISQSVDMIETKVSSVEGDVSTLQQTSTSLTTRVTNAEGDISSLQQTSSSLSSRISSAEGSASYAVQTANSVSLEVSGKVDKGSVINRINLGLEGTTIDANKINLNGATTVNKRFYIDENGYLHLNSTNLTIELLDNGDSPYADSGLKIKSDNGKCVYGPNGIKFNGSTVVLSNGQILNIGNTNGVTTIYSAGKPRVYYSYGETSVGGAIATEDWVRENFELKSE